MRRRDLTNAIVCAVTVMAAARTVPISAAGAAEITVLASPAVKEVYVELVPTFEHVTQHNVSTTWAGTVDILKKIRAGEVFDVVILADETIDQLIREGKIVPGSRIDLAKTGIGLAVHSGAPKPDISNLDALKRTLLTAKSIGYSSGPSGLYLASLFDRMGISEQLKPKLRTPKPGAPIGDMVASGEVEIGFQAIAELLPTGGIDVVELPPGIQHMAVFSSGIHVNAKEPNAARELANVFKSPAATPIIRKHGMEPG